MFLIFQNQLTMSTELWDILLHVYTEDDLSETVSTDLMIIIPIRLVFNGPVIQTLIFGLIWLGKKRGTYTRLVSWGVLRRKYSLTVVCLIALNVFHCFQCEIIFDISQCSLVKFVNYLMINYRQLIIYITALWLDYQRYIMHLSSYLENIWSKV